MHDSRKIIHIDMDAFYASVEQRDNPKLKGYPVIVGGEPEQRGVVAACSYEARRFGIHSAMSSARAKRLCPHAVFLPPRFDEYEAASDAIMEIFSEYTDCVEPLSLDEAFLDVTVNRKHIALARAIAQEIRQRIKDSLSLTASAGVSYNKFLAKAASDFKKPDGLTVIPPEKAFVFIAKLPIRKFPGVGKVTEQKMLSYGIKTGADLMAVPREDLLRWFGKSGGFFYGISHGYDPRPVIPERERKSIGKEITLAEDTDDLDLMSAIISQLGSRVSRIMKGEGITGRTVTLKLKYHDFQSITRSITLKEFVDDAQTITRQSLNLLRDTDAGSRKVRLLGVSLSHFPDSSHEVFRYTQMLLPFG
ncbi:MAG TPA: DNA polymerase IV [Desulfomonilia bacterium]|nr:DNA polymerase IV [Desulfomonilia bacterium]